MSESYAQFVTRMPESELISKHANQIRAYHVYQDKKFVSAIINLKRARILWKEICNRAGNPNLGAI